jgi:hypothetical protein
LVKEGVEKVVVGLDAEGGVPQAGLTSSNPCRTAYPATIYSIRGLFGHKMLSVLMRPEAEHGSSMVAQGN